MGWIYRLFGIYQRFSKYSMLDRFRCSVLDLPILIMVLFSFGFVFDLTSDLRIPLISFAEQVPSRMFILPLVFLMVLGTVRMQEFLPQIRSSATQKFLTLGAIVQLTHSLSAHSWFWRVPSNLGSRCCYTHPPFDAPGSDDFLYTTAFKISVVISGLALGSLVFLFYQNVWRRGSSSPAQ